MRVAYVCTDPGVPVFGHKGASVHVQAVLRALATRGAKVQVVAARPGGDPPLDLEDVHVHALPLDRGGDAVARETSNQRADAEVVSLLSRLHAEHPLDLVYERYALWGRSATAWAADHGVRSLLEVNAPLVEEQSRHRVLVDRRRAEEVAVQALSTADAVVCVSDAVATWARRQVPDGSRIHTLPNGVDTARVRPSGRPVAPASGTPFTLGFVGTLKPWHGVETLVDAAGLLVAADPSYRLLVVGDGPERDPLRARAERLGISDHVEMTGSVDPADVPSLLRRMDVAVAPYPPQEDFYFSPLKIYEYLAAGLAVLASRVGDLPEALDHGRLGVLVEPGDARALAAAVTDLRADPERRAELGRSARARAVDRHDWSGVVASALALAGVTDPVLEVAHGCG